jgi:Glycosyl transferase family 2
MAGRARVLRQWRRRTTGKTTSGRNRPTVAVMTVARDEAVMLPRWIDYYGSQVGVDNLVVIDDNSADGSTDDLPCPVLRIPGFGHKGFEARRVRLVSGLAAGLLQAYDVAIFVDADEFLVPDPDRYDGLEDFLRQRQHDVIAPLAFNVVHHVGAEGPLHPGRPVLGQRQLAKLAPVMCKPSMKRIDAPWAAASHGVRAPYAVDPGVFMMHLKFADRDLLQDVADRRNALAEQDGRGSNASWRFTGDAMVEVLERSVEGVDLDAVPDFDPAGVDLSGLVIQEGEVWRAPGPGHLMIMERQPLVKIPRRLHGAI